jgi:deoxyribonuclease V
VRLFAAADVHYLPLGGARAALVMANDVAFSSVVCEETVMVPDVAPYQPGAFFRRELPPLRAVLANAIAAVQLLVIDGYVDLDPHGRPGLGAHAHEEFRVPVIGVAKTGFATAVHAVPVLRGRSARPLFVTAAGIPVADAADLVRAMTGKYRLPDALRRVDALARGRVRPVKLRSHGRLDYWADARPGSKPAPGRSGDNDLDQGREYQQRDCHDDERHR